MEESAAWTFKVYPRSANESKKVKILHPDFLPEVGRKRLAGYNARMIALSAPAVLFEGEALQQMPGRLHAHR
ncbi:MAG: hypothetical protein L0Y43_04565 [Methylococcaceae bacterium]|nr:hypothetical protein [Methylococcaceae bacterium]